MKTKDGTINYRRGYEPNQPVVIDTNMTTALLNAGYRPPNTMLKRENQIVWLGFYGEKDGNTPSGQGQIDQNPKDDNIQSSGGKGRSHTTSEPISQGSKDNVGGITSAPTSYVARTSIRSEQFIAIERSTTRRQYQRIRNIQNKKTS